MQNTTAWILLLGMIFVSCDKGLEPPPPPPPTGTIWGTVTYQGNWPPIDSLQDLRFVAFKIVPQTPADFTNFANFYFSNGLDRFVTTDTFIIENVPNGNYPYSGIANRYGGNLFLDWRPLGLFTGNGGRGVDVLGDTVKISLVVNFQNLPPFPPAKEVLQ